jgi:SAM-dependent methyltransferase
VTDWANPAAWYDVLNPWGPGDDFYLDLVMSAGAVLDVGCGTGTLLHRARDAGHRGRLCGLDSDPAMLDQARTRDDIEWVLADAASAAWDREFDLAVMAGHAFQQLVVADELHGSLRAIRTALRDGGRFAFETRHPRARAWEGWDTSFEARNPDGDIVRVTYALQEVTGDVVRLTETLAGRWWDRPRVGHGTLRFLGPEALAAFLHEAGFVIDRQFGDLAAGTADGRQRGDHHHRPATVGRPPPSGRVAVTTTRSTSSAIGRS